jgi:hypothetical protein
MAFIAALCPFVLPLFRRESLAWGKGTRIQIPWYVAEDAARDFCRFVQSPEARTKVAAVERAIPADAVVALWTQFSFLFERPRNQVVDIDPAGLLSPGALADFRRSGSYLEALGRTGAQFLVLQHANGGRSREEIAATARFAPPRERAGCEALLAFLDEIDLLAKSGAVVHQDGLLTILRLPSAQDPPLPVADGRTAAGF